MNNENDDKYGYIEYEDGTRVKLDADDAPELTEEMLNNTKWFKGAEGLKEILGEENAKQLTEGKVGRPISLSPKQQITLRLDEDILKEFRSHGKGWQTEINSVLRQWIEDRPS